MKVLLLENSRKKRIALHEELEEKKVKVTSCSSSDSFLSLVSEDKGFDKIVMNEEFWDKGRSIYSYFNVASKLADIPLITYNANENFSNICDRAANSSDQILHKPVDNSLIIEAVVHN